MHPALGRFTIELWRLYAAAEELKSAYGYRHDREDASYGEAGVERKEAPYGAKGRSRDETGHRRRERVNDRLADPTAARLVPIPVGTRDPVDRVRASRKCLLDDRRYRRRDDEQREDPAHPPEAERERPGKGDEPGGKQHPERCRPRQQKPRHMHGRPNAFTQSQQRTHLPL